MTDKVLEKYHKSLEKMEMKSTLKGLMKLPNICDKFEERFFEFERLLLNTKRESDPKKCLKIVKKVENSTEYIDLLDNCLIHKFKDIEKIYKNYSKKIDKIILTKFKWVEYLSKKIQKNKDKGIIIRINPSFEKKYIILENKKNQLFAEFMKKNKKALADLKKKDKKAYITFFVVRHRLGCFVLPQSEI
jgi:predicted RND superfamily exporter protein